MTPGLSPSLALLAIQQKHLAERQRTQGNLVFLAGVLIGLATAVGWLLTADDGNAKNAFFYGLVGGIAVAAVVLIAWRMITKDRRAKCPVCEYSWEILEGRSVPSDKKMEAWKACPGCGMCMENEVLQTVARGSLSAP